MGGHNVNRHIVRKVALPLAAVAAVGTGAAAYAATASSGSTAVTGPYYMCVNSETHAVTTIHGHGLHPSCKDGKLLFRWKVVGERGPRGARGPAGADAPAWRSEVDNGAEFALSKGALGDTSAPAASYADAGVVVDLGSTDDLTADSFAYTGTVDAGSLNENVWIGNGPQASTPGVYSLEDVDFCYGLGSTATPTTFQMNAGCGADAGQTLDIDTIKAHYPGLEAYAWVGVTNQADTVNGHVDTAGGQAVNADFGVRVNDDTTLTAFVTPGA